MSADPVLTRSPTEQDGQCSDNSKPLPASQLNPHSGKTQLTPEQNPLLPTTIPSPEQYSKPRSTKLSWHEQYSKPRSGLYLIGEQTYLLSPEGKLIPQTIALSTTAMNAVKKAVSTSRIPQPCEIPTSISLSTPTSTPALTKWVGNPSSKSVTSDAEPKETAASLSCRPTFTSTAQPARMVSSSTCQIVLPLHTVLKTCHLFQLFYWIWIDHN